MPAEEDMKKSSILKITTLFICLLGFAVLFTSAKKNNRKTNARLNEVVVYTYDSFVSERGTLTIAIFYIKK